MTPETEAAGARDFRNTVEMDESQIVNTQWRGYVRARDNGHLTYVREARSYDRYYAGEQWDQDVLAKLAEQNRPAQTINLILSTINTVFGSYLQTRQDIRVKAVDHEANEEVAEALCKIIRHITLDSKSRNVEKQVFGDGVIQDRGFFDIRLDYSENVMGEIREISLDPLDVLVDPGARDYDPRTWAEVYITRWMTPDELEVLYGQEPADKVRFADEATTFGYDSIEFDPATFSGKAALYSRGPEGFTYQDDWKQVRRVRVIERQYYKLGSQKFFVDLATGDTSPIPDEWDDARIQGVVQALAQTAPVSVQKRIVRRVRWTVTCDKQLLHDGWSPYDHFTVVPFFPYFRRGKGFGIVRNLVGSQDILNKVVSQELHVINTTANSGWIVEEGSLSNMTTQQLESVGAKTGLVLSHHKNTAPPVKIQPNQIPSGLDRISQKTVGFFREISGVSDAMMGMPGREISGTALENKQNAGNIQLATVFDNLAITRQIRGEYILGMIQRFYTDTRLMRIVGVGEEGEEQQEKVALNQPSVTGEILNDVTLGEYKIVVTSAPSKDTESDSELQQLIQMREIGVAIPDWALIESSTLENRKELADWNRRMTGAAEPTPEEMQIAQMTQQLDLQAKVAAVDELRAKAQERMANAHLLMAQAESLPEQLKLDAQKFGAELRQDMEQSMLDLQKTREELMTRLAVMREKSQVAKYTSGLQTLTKRLDTEAKERIAEMRGNVKVTTSK